MIGESLSNNLPGNVKRSFSSTRGRSSLEWCLALPPCVPNLSYRMDPSRNFRSSPQIIVMVPNSLLRCGR